MVDRVGVLFAQQFQLDIADSVAQHVVVDRDSYVDGRARHPQGARHACFNRHMSLLCRLPNLPVAEHDWCVQIGGIFERLEHHIGIDCHCLLMQYWLIGMPLDLALEVVLYGPLLIDIGAAQIRRQ